MADNEGEEGHTIMPWEDRDVSEDENTYYYNIDDGSGDESEPVIGFRAASVEVDEDDEHDDFQDEEEEDDDDDDDYDYDDPYVPQDTSNDPSNNDQPVGSHIRFQVVAGDDEGQDIAAMRLVALLRGRMPVRPSWLAVSPAADMEIRIAGQRSGLLTRQQLIALFRGHELRAERSPRDPNRFPKVPSEEGRKLMNSGVFGANDGNFRTKKSISRYLLERELGIGSLHERRRINKLLSQRMIPVSKPEHIIHYDHPIYSGQFSDDGNFFYSCCQDFNVHMYDTTNPYNFEYYKTVSYPFGQWTLTDATLSPDNRWLAYSSIQSAVSIAPTDPKDEGDPYSLELDDGHGSRRLSWWQNRGSFGIWSIRFSGDGRELIAGTSAHSIIVYDIESRRVVSQVNGHGDDVNAVSYADKRSPHIIYSGSDDTTIKVWDRRSMGDGREAGAFVGHIEGLTYIDSKEDGRYLISNGKDQSAKLWDLRKMMSTDRFRRMDLDAHRIGQFDYRGEEYDDNDWYRHPDDNSVVTFRGHKVLRTLIRCHFSPPNSTNSRYVYSGSADGKVYIWNLDATVAGVIDVEAATRYTRKAETPFRRRFTENVDWSTCVRDASWHPSAPVIVASAWNGYSMAQGTCSVHAFNMTDGDEGDPEMGQSTDEMMGVDNSTFFQTEL
ncbi:LEC14B-like protein [Cladobotryum mycophilum]|uniref:LEC14B-like protein n=1 Tax=Cladobotryum mycophilum TaxID=491253 RepID=A0ABR0T388_9HYPO